MKIKSASYKVWMVSLLVAILILPVGCSKDGDKGESKRPIKVTLATAKNVWCSLPLIALEKGFFDKEGLDVDAQYLQGGRYCLDALLSKSAEFANIVEVNVAYIAYTGNTNLSVLANVVSSESSAIAARKSSGILKPEDIRGKRLAISPAMTSEIFAHRFLKKYGMTQKDVEIHKVQPLAMQATMAGKGADAASTWQPFIYNIQRSLGDDAIVFTDPEIYTGYETLAVRKDWAAQNPKVVKAFLRALKLAEAFAKEHPEEAKTIVAKAINLDREIVDAIWSEFNMSLVLDEKHMTNEVTAIGKWIRETQQDYLGKPLPDYSQYFDDSYLRSSSSK